MSPQHPAGSIARPQGAAGRYLDLVHEGRNEWWRYALSVLLVAFCWLWLGYLPFRLFAGEAGAMTDFVLVNLSIFLMLAGLAVAVKWIHRRPLLTLVTPEAVVDWRRIARGARVWFALGLLTAAAEHSLFPGRYYLSFDPQRFFAFAVLVLVLTPIQSAAEELIFRGYVMQGLSLLTRSPALIAVASSLIFAAPHLFNPEVERHGVAMMGALYFAIGLILATVALRDGRLELAIGLHAANNVFLALVANYEGSALATESIVTARELDPGFALITLVLGGLAFHWWTFRRD